MVNQVAVLGSANADVVVEVPSRPAAGETILGSDIRVFAGGKGANQAAAAARSGATTRFIACVGADKHADLIRRKLAAAGVDIEGMQPVSRPTGTALIYLTPDGENSIVVSPGANSALDVASALAAASRWNSVDVLVLNLETPLDTVEYVAAKAAACGVRVVINAAPAERLQVETLAVCDPLIVNEHEARTLLDDAGPSSFTDLARLFLGAGVRSAVITLGSAGSVVADGHGIRSVPAHAVHPVDTTGAGDAFVGATACELACGATLIDAVRFATAVSAMSVQAMGAQDSYPDRRDVEAFIHHAAQGSSP